jgi:hypothetical protein
MSRTQHLRAALERSQERARYCRRRFDGLAGSGALTTDAGQRTHKKLLEDLKRAESDASNLQRELDDAMD